MNRRPAATARPGASKALTRALRTIVGDGFPRNAAQDDAGGPPVAENGQDGSGKSMNGARRPQMLILEGYPTQEQQDLLGPNRGSRRWRVAEERASIQVETAVEARSQGMLPVPPPVHATYCFVVPDHGRRDWDNYALICKPVQDGLVKAGILVGDHFAVLTATVAFRVEKGRRRLEVTLAPSRPAGDRGEG